MMNKINNKTILVTGAAGFIGFWLSERLLTDNWNVVGLDNINDYYDVNLKYARLQKLGINREKIENNKIVENSENKNFIFFKLNLEDTDHISKLFDHYDFDVVCHLGAQAGVRYSIENPMAYVNSNLIGFTNILEQCRLHQVSHLVYASSSSVYGLNTKMPFSTHDSANHPVSFYAATKKSNELMAHVYSRLYDLPTTGLRFFTVYGPWGRPDMSPMIFADAIMHNKPIKVFNHGNMRRDFTYIKDIIEGVVRVIDKLPEKSETWQSDKPDPATSSAPYKIYNMGNSSPVLLMDYIETMEKALGKKAMKEFLPMQQGDVQNTFSDVSDLKDELGYCPNTTIEDGLYEFANWYKKYYKI